MIRVGIHKIVKSQYIFATNNLMPLNCTIQCFCCIRYTIPSSFQFIINYKIILEESNFFDSKYFAQSHLN